MSSTLTYTVFSLGEAQLHQLHTSNGKVSQLSRGHLSRPLFLLVEYYSTTALFLYPLPAAFLPMQLFVMGEVAVELFQESPTAFLQVRSGPCR